MTAFLAVLVLALSSPSPSPSPVAPQPSATPLVRVLPNATPAGLPTPTARGRVHFYNGFVGPADDRPIIALDGYGTVAYALRHAPSLLAQEATVTNLDLTYTKDRAAEFPTLTAQLQNQIQKNANTNGSLAQFGLSPASNFSQNTAQLEASYNIYNGGQQLVTQEAKRQVESAKYELQRLEEQLAITVTNNFYALAALHETVVVDENDLTYERALLSDARASEHVGRVAGVDVLRAQVAVTRAQSGLIQARVNERNARDSLAVQLGAPYGTFFAVPEAIPEPKTPTIAIELLDRIAKLNRPEVLEAKATLQSARLADASVDNDLRPVVTLGGAFGSQVSPTSLVQEQQQIDAQNAANLASYQTQQQLYPNAIIAPPVTIPPVDRNRPGFWQFSISSTFQAPLYDWGQRAAAHHAAKAQIESSVASLYNAYDFVRSDVATAQRNLEAADAQLQLAKASEALGTESARIAQLQYKNGLISFTDATQTEQTALASQNDLVSARATYVTALVRLRVSLAPPDTESAADLRGL